MYLNFEPHSWYRGAAIKDNRASGHEQGALERPIEPTEGYRWSAYIENGNTYRVDERHADTLKELKQNITKYREAETARIERLYK